MMPHSNREESIPSLEGTVNGGWLRAAGAGRHLRPRRLVGASARLLNFTVRRLPGGLGLLWKDVLLWFA
jgi:hypothetical protein